jgi:alpha-tubulin suppressor-like RCC1 family protein
MRNIDRTLVAMLAAGMVAALGCREDITSPTEPESTPALTTASTPLSFRQISPGTNHSCGVTTDNRAYCWGNNSFNRPVAAATNLQFLEVRAGLSYTCGLTTDNRIYCWGFNAEGQLGNGSSSDYSADPVLLAGGRRYRLLRAGLGHACAITLADVTFCWGSNDYGQLGDGTTTDRRSPVRVAGGITFLRVSTGGLHTCGLTSAHIAYCWGKNTEGQIGIGNSITQLKPVVVSGGLAFNTVSAGGSHTCGVTTNNKAYCWGWNKYGQLGDGTRDRHGRPFPVAGGLTFSGVSPGGSHTCGVTTTKAAYCWGFNWFGQLGDGTNATADPFVIQRLSPVAVAGGLKFDAVLAAAGLFTCGVATGSRGYCWGENTHGQLGDGTTTDRSTPVAVVGT